MQYQLPHHLYFREQKAQKIESDRSPGENISVLLKRYSSSVPQNRRCPIYIRSILEQKQFYWSDGISGFVCVSNALVLPATTCFFDDVTAVSSSKSCAVPLEFGSFL
ncbi:conserved hypothetical protein [Ricinus communis]|uniref:Uncharacterized protein n=1 Tax=Ricinus communis TaxID=3988 RepID=B9T4A9_RICCO|nr:conserved hypothetical protein [Ricinus communis]